MWTLVPITTNTDSFDIKVWPSIGSEQIIINYPGRNGDIDGYNDKYATVAHHAATSGLGAFVQMPNINKNDSEYPEALIANLHAVVAWVKRNTPICCGASYKNLCLAGFSAGGSAVAAVAHAVDAQKILLMAPSFNVPAGIVNGSLRAYTGELYVAVGSDDTVVGAGVADVYYDMASHSRRRYSCTIPDCDHQFRGRKNGQIMAKAYLWAFGNHETDFPKPDGGLVLYE